MEVNLTRNNDQTGLLNVKFSTTELSGEYKKRLNKAASTLKVNGFRPGKVPASYVERMYGPGIKSETLVELINKGISGYLRENNILPVGRLKVIKDDSEKIDQPDAEFEFHYQIGIEPEVELADISHEKVKKFVVNVADEDVDGEIEDLRRQHGAVDEQPVSDDTSILECTYHGANHEQVNPSEQKTYLRVENAAETVKQSLIGIAPGAHLDINLVEAYGAEEAKRLLYIKDEAELPTGETHLHVVRVLALKPADLGPELYAKALGSQPGTTEGMSEDDFKEAMKERVKGNLERNLQSMEWARLKKMIVENNPVLIPEENLELELQEYYGERKKELTDEIRNAEKAAMKEGLVLKALEKQMAGDKEGTRAEFAEAGRIYFNSMGYGGFFEGMDDEAVIDIVNRHMKENKQAQGTISEIHTLKMCEKYALEHGQVETQNLTYQQAIALLNEQRAPVAQ